ncbi:MAG: hypothetical protein IRZ31_17710 [Thermogemmatispora sp.]|uniref:hypothetical protein n=1 Tax=Thermogemmatispora sp. TaxID=1968838 RepID=UPI0026283BEA|nr:hypothetical protein [Thermogemmatispora sp.]MBX5458732.1 hypothetical protein [Thermogemmatispora sp.]
MSLLRTEMAGPTLALGAAPRGCPFGRAFAGGQMGKQESAQVFGVGGQADSEQELMDSAQRLEVRGDGPGERLQLGKAAADPRDQILTTLLETFLTALLDALLTALLETLLETFFDESAGSVGLFEFGDQFVE